MAYCSQNSPRFDVSDTKITMIKINESLTSFQKAHAVYFAKVSQGRTFVTKYAMIPLPRNFWYASLP